MPSSRNITSCGKIPLQTHSLCLRSCSLVKKEEREKERDLDRERRRRGTARKDREREREKTERQGRKLKLSVRVVTCYKKAYGQYSPFQE